jgi:hypothetical protein
LGQLLRIPEEEESMSEVDKAKLIAEFHEKMEAVGADEEEAHIRADEFCLRMLRLLGHGDVADAWQEERERRDGWWYA